MAFWVCGLSTQWPFGLVALCMGGLLASGFMASGLLAVALWPGFLWSSLNESRTACPWEPLSRAALPVSSQWSSVFQGPLMVAMLSLWWRPNMNEFVGTTVILASDLGWDSRWRISDFLPKDTYNQSHGFIVSWSFEVQQPINILLITRHVKFCHFLLNHRTFVWCGSPVHWNAPNSSRV